MLDHRTDDYEAGHVMGSLHSAHRDHLRGLIIDTFAPTWQQKAACNGEDPNMFYPVIGESKAEKNDREAHAKAICAVCSIKDICREEGRARNDEGIWGGLTKEDRNGKRVRK